MIHKWIMDELLKKITLKDIMSYIKTHKLDGFLITVESLDGENKVEITIKNKSS